MNDINTDVLIEKLASELPGYIRQNQLESPAMVGIHTGGAWVAQRIYELLSFTQPLGSLDINFYRDDFSRSGLHPVVAPSHLPFDVDNQDIILVDDVLHTGRTIRAAMNEIFDYGRPSSITLVVLAQRNGRELPIQADICGKNFDLSREQHLKLSGPEPLSLAILDP